MDRMGWKLPGVLCAALALLGAAAPGATPKDIRVVQRMAEGIAALKHAYPQLADFDPRVHAHPNALRIDYAYHTHAPAPGAGWTAGVPHPDDDGVWFHLDLHAPDSTLQLHTQPMQARPLCLGRWRVSLLVLDGARTRSLAGALGALLRNAGAAPCAAPNKKPPVTKP